MFTWLPSTRLSGLRICHLLPEAFSDLGSPMGKPCLCAHLQHLTSPRCCAHPHHTVLPCIRAGEFHDPHLIAQSPLPLSTHCCHRLPARPASGGGQKGTFCPHAKPQLCHSWYNPFHSPSLLLREVQTLRMPLPAFYVALCAQAASRGSFLGIVRFLVTRPISNAEHLPHHPQLPVSKVIPTYPLGLNVTISLSRRPHLTSLC